MTLPAKSSVANPSSSPASFANALARLEFWFGGGIVALSVVVGLLAIGGDGHIGAPVLIASLIMGILGGCVCLAAWALKGPPLLRWCSQLLLLVSIIFLVSRLY